MSEKEEIMNEETQPEEQTVETEPEAAETEPQTQTETFDKEEVQLAEFEQIDDSKPRSRFTDHKFDFLQDLELNIYIELGKAKMKIKDILELERGYVIELDKLASEPVDIFVNNKKIADGEVVVIDKHFGIRIMNLNDPANKIGEMY